MLIKYNNDFFDKSKFLKTSDLIDEFLNDYPDIANVVTNFPVTSQLLIDTTDIPDIAFFINEIIRKISCEFQSFQIKKHISIFKDVYLHNLNEWNGTLHYYNILKVLNNNNLPAIESLFFDYGVFYKETLELNKYYFDSTKFNPHINTAIRSGCGYQYEESEKEKSITLEYIISKANNIKIRMCLPNNINDSTSKLKRRITNTHSSTNKIYRFSSEGLSKMKHDKLFDFNNVNTTLTECTISKLKSLIDLDSISLIETTSDGTILLDNKRAIVFNNPSSYTHNQFYHYSSDKFDTIYNKFSIFVYDIVNGYIEANTRLITPQKRRTIINEESVFNKITEKLNTISLHLMDDEFICSKFAELDELKRIESAKNR